MTEIWKPIPGYEGLYEVSDIGRVKRLPGLITHRNRWGQMTRRKPAKIIAATAHRNGHLRLALYRDGRGSLQFVHRLVALAFLGPPPEGKPLAAHIDGNPSHNVAANIYWASPADNSADSIRHGTQVRGERVGISRLTAADVRSIRERGQPRAGHAALAREFGVTPRSIKLVILRQTWSHI